MGYPVSNELARNLRDSFRRIEHRDKATKRRSHIKRLLKTKGQLHERINACFNGQGTVGDFRFIAEHVGDFERPLDGNPLTTSIDFRRGVA